MLRWQLMGCGERGRDYQSKVMKNKVYYGEYTLKHWIRLMLKEEIVLPEYQRHFVWSERDLSD